MSAEGEALRSFRQPATVPELIVMMNRRPGVTARFVTGDELRYFQAVQAAASHTLLDGRRSLILVRRDVATRADLLHEWLHRLIQLRHGSPIPNEEQVIEDFLHRYRWLLRMR